jgi:hypothetical protein
MVLSGDVEARERRPYTTTHRRKSTGPSHSSVSPHECFVVVGVCVTGWSGVGGDAADMVCLSFTGIDRELELAPDS